MKAEKTPQQFHKLFGLDKENLAYMDLHVGRILYYLQPYTEEDRQATIGVVARLHNIFTGEPNGKTSLADISRHKKEDIKNLRNMGSKSFAILEAKIYEMGGWFYEDYLREDAKEFIAGQIKKGQALFAQHPEFIRNEYDEGRFPAPTLDELEPENIALQFVKDTLAIVQSTDGDKPIPCLVPAKNAGLVLLIINAFANEGYSAEINLSVAKKDAPPPP